MSFKYIFPEQIILVPQRFSQTPTPKQLSEITAGQPFKSPSCLLECKVPGNFVSVSWDKRVNFCSFAQGKEPLRSMDYISFQKVYRRGNCKINQRCRCAKH